MVMLKAFAYGSDALHVAQYLQNDADYFGVAYSREGIALRNSGLATPILVQMVVPEEVEDVVHFSLEPIVSSEEMARLLAEEAEKRGKNVKVHLAIDTGMGRFGVLPDELVPLAQVVADLPNLVIQGLMTHLSSADDVGADSFTRQQIRQFQQAITALKHMGIRPPLVHAAATSAAARFPEAQFSMIRLGLGLYGLYPSDDVAKAIQLECPMALVSKVGSIKSFPQGFPIGYGRTYVTPSPKTLAYIPIGYHDGLSRRLSNRGYVKIKGKKAPIVGSVCMDFISVDISEIDNVQIGETALLFGDWRGQSIRVETLADIEGTIPYDVLCRLSERIQRIYLLDEF